MNNTNLMFGLIDSQAALGGLHAVTIRVSNIRFEFNLFTPVFHSRGGGQNTELEM